MFAVPALVVAAALLVGGMVYIFKGDHEGTTSTLIPPMAGGPESPNR